MLRAVDLFCGAGGSTAGAEASGRVKVVLAVTVIDFQVKERGSA